MKFGRVLAVIVLCALCLFAQSTITNGLKNVTTGGTAVQLAASSTLATWVTVQAKSTNTGTICVGGSTVLASTRSGTCLTAGQAAPMYAVQAVPYDLSLIWIDATVNGEGVAFTYAR
jgi:hypothetical protein